MRMSAITKSITFRRPLLQDPFGALKRLAPVRGKVFPAAINEVLDHADARAQPFGRDVLSGHRLGDFLGGTHECSGRRKSRHRFNVSNPILFACHTIDEYYRGAALTVRPFRRGSECTTNLQI